MGLIGAGRIERQEKCTVCQKTFEEDELKLVPYAKTNTVELMCESCSGTQIITPEVTLTTEKTEEKDKIITEKKPNPMKEAVNATKKEVKAKSMCNCAKFPLCKAIRAIQAFDEFSNSEIRAYFISGFGDYFKIDFCPFCSKSLYKK